MTNLSTAFAAGAMIMGYGVFFAISLGKFKFRGRVIDGMDVACIVGIIALLLAGVSLVFAVASLIWSE